jgi:hypothetical protein
MQVQAKVPSTITTFMNETRHDFDSFMQSFQKAKLPLPPSGLAVAKRSCDQDPRFKQAYLWHS